MDGSTLLHLHQKQKGWDHTFPSCFQNTPFLIHAKNNGGGSNFNLGREGLALPIILATLKTGRGKGWFENLFWSCLKMAGGDSKKAKTLTIGSQPLCHFEHEYLLNYSAFFRIL